MLGASLDVFALNVLYARQRLLCAEGNDVGHTAI